MSSVLAGSFFTAGPPGKPHGCVLSHFCCVLLFETLWTVARQAPLSVAFPSQEYWSGLPFLSPGDLPDPGIKPESPAGGCLPI